MRLQLIAPLALLIAVLAAVGARGQTIVNWQGGATNNNWTDPNNWDTFAPPFGAFNEVANIENGGTAILNSNLATLDAPGGLSVSNGSKLDIIGSGAFVVDITGGSVTGAAAFENGAILALTGASTSFSSTGLSFANGGRYEPVINGVSHGLISVSGGLALGGGTLKPTFGFSPTGGQSWVLADAASISGNFALDTSSTGLPFGRRAVTEVASGGTNGRLLRLKVENTLGLTVNADTGAASISSPTASAITMTGYGIASASGQLKPASWSSVTSQVGGGWGVAGTPSANHIDELGGPIPPGNTTQASLTISSTARAIGSPFNQNLPFGVAPDLKFEYVNSSDQLVQADVQYTGLNAVNNLLLTVDPSTGQARLRNSSKTTIKLRGYSILSDDGSLKPTNGSWNSLDDQGLTGVDEANASTTNLSELIPQVADSLTLTSGQSYNLGSLFNTSGERDLRLEFFYTGPGTLPGDFNSDGAVNQTDLTLWQAGYGTTYNGRDFLAWQRNFGGTSSTGAPTIATGVVKYEALAPLSASTTVPEPVSLQLAFLVGAVAASVRCRRQRAGRALAAS